MVTTNPADENTGTESSSEESTSQTQDSSYVDDVLKGDSQSQSDYQSQSQVDDDDDDFEDDIEDDEDDVDEDNDEDDSEGKNEDEGGNVDKESHIPPVDLDPVQTEARALFTDDPYSKPLDKEEVVENAKKAKEEFKNWEEDQKKKAKDNKEENADK